ncbi:MAG TPA: cohesin domain-containing protein [Xanthomonadales bacterium]|nr:cohesin domain-containing protein [Xanthomonadales bacterium]
MSKKLILVLVVFILALCNLAYIKFFFNQEGATYPQFSRKKVVSNQPLEASLSFLPNTLIATSSAITSAEVILETNSQPTIVQLEIAYDPTALYSVSILPGDYFIEPEIPLEKIDYKNGRISYAISGKSVNSASNRIATINFTPVNYGIKKSTEIKFLQKTSLRQNSKVVELKYAIGATIVIKPSFFIPVATPSAAIVQ